MSALAGSFMAALAAALSVYAMTRIGLPVSTTQAIVGAIIGWNLFSGTPTDTDTLTEIVATWVVCPVLAAVFSILLFKLVTWLLRARRLHLVRGDAYTRLGLVLAAAFGAYSLGANNIANVMGVFVPVSPFTDFNLLGMTTVSSAQQLFGIGALAIAVGVFTYSRKVVQTVGTGLLTLKPVAAWVVVMAHFWSFSYSRRRVWSSFSPPMACRPSPWFRCRAPRPWSAPCSASASSRAAAASAGGSSAASARAGP